MLTATGRAMEVWGDPISHSLSPSLHRAAHRVLGLDWTYGRRRVDVASFPAALSAASTPIRGLSLTMPLKRAAFAAADSHDEAAVLTGAANTLVAASSGLRGCNTDVGGIARDLAAKGLDHIDRVRLVGAGATATSAVVAFARLHVASVEVAARHPDRATGLIALGERCGVRVTTAAWDAAPKSAVPLTFAALPGGAAVPDDVADATAAAGGVLYDVVYAPWPTALARAWARHGGRAVAGLGMLVEQAILQVRLFLNGDAEAPLPHEDDVRRAMAAAVTDA